jgi:hypothetical protein
MAPTFSGLHFFILYDPLEFSTGNCPTPGGTEMVISHQCVYYTGTLGALFYRTDGTLSFKFLIQALLGKDAKIDTYMSFQKIHKLNSGKPPKSTLQTISTYFFILWKAKIAEVD